MNNAPKNAFHEVLDVEYGNDMRLGLPAASLAQFDRRMAALAHMTGGNGFRTPKKAARLFADGTTRGERKRKARDAANARVSEVRKPEFMHRAARIRLSEAA